MRLPAPWLVAVLALAACDEAPVAVAPPPAVRVETVAEPPPAGFVTYTASLIAETQVNVAFQSSGNILALMQVPGIDGTPRKIQQGDRVRLGDVLATVDPSQYRDNVQSAQANLAAAQATLADAEANWRRTEALYATRSATATDYDNARQQYDSARAQVSSTQAQLASAQTYLSYTELTAPMDGVVLDVPVEVGTLVSPQTVGVVLADTSRIKAVFGVPDAALGSITMGEPIAVNFAQLPDGALDGLVTSIAPSADSSTRLFEVEVTLPNPDGRLLVGMIASLGLPHGGDAAALAAVPVDALVRSETDPKGYAVFLLEKHDGKDVAVLRDVGIGQVAGNRIAITSGLEPGEQVIVVGTNTATDGGEVRVVP